LSSAAPAANGSPSRPTSRIRRRAEVKVFLLGQAAALSE
jgi:hypothetical protein